MVPYGLGDFDVEKNDIFRNVIIFNVCLLFAAITCGIFTGCASTRVNASDGDVLAYQAKITRLEDTISSYQYAIGYTIQELGDIRERASGAEGTVDEIIYLFDEYQRRVDEVLRRYRTLQEYLGREDSNSNLSSNIHGD